MISVWLDTSELNVNVDKTKLLVVSRKRSPPAPRVMLRDREVENIQLFRYLGVTFTADLTWSRYIENMHCKAHRMLGFLYRNFSQANQGCLSHLYKTLLLEYCPCVWDPH